jgi:hypothetical protein
MYFYCEFSMYILKYLHSLDISKCILSLKLVTLISPIECKYQTIWNAVTRTKSSTFYTNRIYFLRLNYLIETKIYYLSNTYTYNAYICNCITPSIWLFTSYNHTSSYIVLKSTDIY